MLGKQTRKQTRPRGGFHLVLAVVETPKQVGQQELDKVVSARPGTTSQCQARTELKAPRAIILTMSEEMMPKTL